jgi:exonuclease VII large subunit
VFRRAEDTMFRAIDRIDASIVRYKDLVSNYAKDLILGFENISKDLITNINNSAKVISLSSPERQLKHGYSIVRSKGKIVKSTKDVETGDDLDITLTDGIIHTIIK